MAGVTSGTVEGPPGGGVVADTVALIDSFDVANFWPLNQQSGGQFGNRGFRPLVGVDFVVAPDSADSTPMVSEPINTATFFDGTANCVEAQNTILIPYTLATNVAFFKAASFVAVQVLYDHGNSGGTIGTRLHTQDDKFLAIIGSEVGDRYICTLTLPASIVVNTWHMIGWRQAVDGNGVDWFFDGTFFANADAEVVNAFDGAGDVDFSYGSIGGPTRFAIGSRANTGISNRFTGSEFHVVIDDKVWTNAQLLQLWELAIANGLNA